MQRIFIALSIWLLLLILVRCQNEKSETTETVSDNIHDGYVGEASCVSCHQTEYQDWLGSHHDWAMKEANEKTVLGNFNNQSVRLDGVDYSFVTDGGEYKVHVQEINGDTATYRIEYTFGYTPLQQYITRFDAGKMQVLRVSWDTEKKEWFHQYAGDQLDPHDWLHWTQGGQRWNTMCADCHSTNLKRNYDHKSDTFSTTWSSINVSCEGCHGPGQQHVDWVQKNEGSGSNYVLPGIGQKAQLDMCGPCHARRVRLTEQYQPGIDFENQFILQSITNEYYHADGQIREEDYVVGSFMQSKMYMNGVKCSDCHNPHSLELKMNGNALCMQCHEPKYNTIEHHFHEMGTESAECVNCHMTGAIYMGNDFRRDHSFRIPRPDQSIQYGTPNACTGCHTDKSDRWAANKIKGWYGGNRPYHYSDDFLITTSGETISQTQMGELLAFIENTEAPDLLRASAIQNAQFTYSRKEVETLLSAMEDTSALVRYYTINKLMDYPPQDRHHIAAKHIGDPSLMVRIAAARLAADIDLNALDADQRSAFSTALREYEKMLIANTDFPLGRLHLGDYYFRKGQTERAIIQYEKSLQMDSLLSVTYQNLATAYSTLGRNEEALKMLDQLITLEPEYSRAYFLRALLFHETGNPEEFVENMQEAIRLDPQNFQAYYNLATYYYQNKNYNEAEKVINKGLKVYPESEQGQYLLSLIQKERSL